MICYGRIKAWVDDRAFGFVRQDLPNSPDIFVHRDALLASGLGDRIEPGTAVKVVAEREPRGLRAIFVELI